MLVLASTLIGNAVTANAASKTWLPTSGGAWTTAANWNPSGAPADGDEVTIAADQSADISAVPAMTLSNLTVNGNCTLAAAVSLTTLTISNGFTVASAKTFNLGASSGRLDFTLASTAFGTIAGTVATTSGQVAFTCNGDLTMTSAGLIIGPGKFILGAGATLTIGSADGISSSGNSGNIQVKGGLTYNAAANYVYDGTTNQNTGTGLPVNLTGTLTINNPGNTVTLNNAETIASGGTVDMIAGTFATGANLTMATTSSINRSGGTMTGTLQGSGVYNVMYTGNSMTTSSELSGAGLNNLTVDMTAGQTLTLSTNAAPNGNLTVNTGALDVSTFTINRPASGGAFTLANGATLLVGGATNFPTNYSTVSLGPTSTVNYDAAGGQTVSAQAYGNVIFSGGGAKTVTSGTSISGNLSIAPTGSATASVGAGLVIPVGSLTLGGQGTANGTWGSTTATLASFQNNTYFAPTTGYLNVSSDIRTTPTVSVWPTASAITYGQTLASSILSGGSASVPGTFAFTSPSIAPNAGTASQSITFTPTDLSLYTTVVGSTSVTVNPKALTVTGVTANDKVYNGNTTATLNTTGAALVGVVNGDSVTLNTTGAVGTFSDPNAGTSKTVLVSGLSISGTAAGNYTLTQPTLSATILGASPGDINDGLNVFITQATGSNYIAMSFKMYKNAAAMGLQYSPQVSADRQTWFSDNANVLQLSVISFDAQFDLVTVRDQTPITPSAPRFIQLTVLSSP